MWGIGSFESKAGPVMAVGAAHHLWLNRVQKGFWKRRGDAVFKDVEILLLKTLKSV